MGVCNALIAIADDIDGFGMIITRLVGSFAAKRVIDITDTHNTCRERNILAGKLVRVSSPIPALMMGECDLLPHLYVRRTATGQNLRTDRRMCLHHLPLMGF